MPIDQSFVSLKLLLSLLGLLFIILGCVAYYVGEKKAINSFVGFRIPPTYRDPEVWKAVNMHTGILFVLHGIFATIAGLVLPKVELLTFLLILLLPLAAVTTYGTGYAYQFEKTI
jgi:uncharacterized membrane protein